tara:strand:+ start:9188 stop:9832 length:645 start_codon:yes stop_codon:yes gene_type:complete
MNRGGLIQRFYDLVDDDVQDLWERARVESLMNDALMEVYRTVEDGDEDYFVKCKDYSVTENANSETLFSLPSDFKRVAVVERLVSGGNPVPAEWVTFSNRFDNGQRWPTTSTITTTRPRVYLKGTHLGVVNPASAYTLRMWYHHVVASMDSDSDVPEAIPTDFHELIALEAAKRAMATEGRVFAFQDTHDRQLASLSIMTKQRQRQEPRFVHLI